MIEITDVKIILIENKETRVRGFANIVIDNAFAIKDIKILEGKKELFICMPSKRTPNGEFKDIAHPINAETRELVQKKIIEKYMEVVNND